MMAVRPAAPPPGAAAGTVTIPYLGTTLPPISVMIRYFGPQADPSHEVTVNFAGHPVVINRVLAGNLAAAGNAIVAAGLGGQVHDVGGFRTAIGGSGSPIPFSMHQFGAAIDINEGSQNWHTMTMDPRIVAIMRSYHWWWGGNWGSVSYDGGHFQFMGGVVPAGAGVPGPSPGPGGGPGAGLGMVLPSGYPPVVVLLLVGGLLAGMFALAVAGAAVVAAGTVAAARKARG